MIASVRGPVTRLAEDSAVIEVGGVGIQVACTPGTLAGLQQGRVAALATSLVVREDSLTLYGFADEDERGVFELLQTASGVGPRLAQAMLAVHGPVELRRAIAGEDLVALCRVPGIGRKGAQRIVLELKDRIGAPPARPTTASAATAGDDWRDPVRRGLLGLGWSAREADAAVEAVEPLARAGAAEGTQPPLAELLRAALRSLTKA